jgi:hypothetical protein
MPTTITVHDRSLDGTSLQELTLDFLTERITVRELIRSHVYQTVTEANAGRIGHWIGLDRSALKTAVERDGNKPKPIDWQPQFDRAQSAFKTGTLLILVDGRQVETLDEEIEVRVDSEVSFLRLTPLIGG